MDGGLFIGGAVLVNVMVLINMYFLWKYRAAYRPMLEKRAEG